MYHVLMPIDNNKKRTITQARAVGSLPHAADSVEVTLLHVYDDEETAENTSPFQLSAGKGVQDYLTGKHSVHSLQPMSKWGEPAEEILKVADEIDADVIVLGGRKRSAMGALLFGSISIDVLRNTDRPVLITGGDEQESLPREP